MKSVDVLDPLRIRFVLDKPWPDFLLFYATPATGAAWIVPRKYIEKVGEDGFRRQPVGLGPYRVVRLTPGVELVLEANEQYWRKKPSIRTIVIKGVPDRTTRLAMLKTGEADIGYLMVGVEASTIKADPKLRLARVIPPAVWWLDYTVDGKRYRESSGTKVKTEARDLLDERRAARKSRKMIGRPDRVTLGSIHISATLPGTHAMVIQVHQIRQYCDTNRGCPFGTQSTTETKRAK